MVESTSRTLVCSVLFLDIAEYSRKPVAEQLQLKQAFNRILGESLEQVAPRDRIILDTGDGAAVTFMGDPEDALFAAMSVRDMAGEAPVRLGVNLGPVRLVKDLNGQMNIIGEPVSRYEELPQFFRETINHHTVKLDQKEYQLRFEAVSIGSRIRIWFYVQEVVDDVAIW